MQEILDKAEAIALESGCLTSIMSVLINTLEETRAEALAKNRERYKLELISCMHYITWQMESNDIKKDELVGMLYEKAKKERRG